MINKFLNNSTDFYVIILNFPVAKISTENKNKETITNNIHTTQKKFVKDNEIKPHRNSF